MGFFRTLARASVLWAQEKALDPLSAIVLALLAAAVDQRGRVPCDGRRIPRRFLQVISIRFATMNKGRSVVAGRTRSSLGLGPSSEGIGDFVLNGY